jgi:hypothetical protein
MRYISGATPVRTASRGEYCRTALTGLFVRSSIHSRVDVRGHQWAGGSTSTVAAPSTTSTITTAVTSSSSVVGPTRNATANGTEPYANAPVARLSVG